MQGRLLGIDRLFLSEVVDVAISLSHGCDPEVAENAARIRKEVSREEDRSVPPPLALQ